MWRSLEVMEALKVIGDPEAEWDPRENWGLAVMRVLEERLEADGSSQGDERPWQGNLQV